MDLLLWLQDWYANRCNGEWEFQGALHIATADDEGWRISIPLSAVELSELDIPQTTIQRSDTDWLSCWTTECTLEIACGAHNLKESLEFFRSWASLL